MGEGEGGRDGGYYQSQQNLPPDDAVTAANKIEQELRSGDGAKAAELYRQELYEFGKAHPGDVTAQNQYSRAILDKIENDRNDKAAPPAAKTDAGQKQVAADTTHKRYSSPK